jgi:quercetin dioxygenase-like cupin family protein
LVAYIVSGELTVTYDTDSGNVTKSYQAGESVLEAIGTRHNGRNDGDDPVRLFAVYLGAEGSENTIRF